MRGVTVLAVLAACSHTSTPMPDAPPDGPPALHFAHTTYDLGVRPMNGPASPQGILASNITSSTVAVTARATGPFIVPAFDCSALAPNRVCSIPVAVQPTALGAATGELVATANGVDVHVDLTATIDGYIEARVAGTGRGRIVLTPAQPCEDGSCAADGTVVTATVTPDPGSQLVSWSEPTCTGTSCAVTAGVDALHLVANLVAGPNAFAVDVTGLGEVGVAQNGTQLAVCAVSCTVAIDTSAPVKVYAATPVDFAGFTGCVAGDECTLPAGSTSTTATFTRKPGELDAVRDDAILALDYDSAGNLVVGAASGVVSLDPQLHVRWTTPDVGVVRVAADDSVFVGTATAIVKLDALGQQVWSVPGGIAARSPDSINYGYRLAPLPGGGVAVNRNGSIDILDANGQVVVQPQAAHANSFAIAASPDGTIYLFVNAPEISPSAALLERYTSAGVRIAPDFPTNGSGLDNEATGRVAVGTRVVASIKAELDDWVGLQQIDANGLQSNLAMRDMRQRAGTFPPHVFATNAADQLAFLHPANKGPFSSWESITVEKLSPTGATLWSFDRLARTLSVLFDTGFEIQDVAIAPDGHVAIAVHYIGLHAMTSVVEVVP